METPEPGDAHPAIERAFRLGGDPARITDYYEDWAATYDEDVAGEVYGVPASCVAVLQSCAGRVSALDVLDPALPILDAGCGTGLVGVALAAAGYRTIDGVDLSPAMAETARERGVYRRLLAPVDLTATPPVGWAHACDVMVIGGVYTLGHLPPSTLGDMLRWVRAGGLLITSVRDAYYEEAGYQEASDALAAAGHATELIHAEGMPYTADSTGHYFAYAVN